MKKINYKVITVMPDFTSSGLWGYPIKNTMIEYEELNISKDLIKDFESWIYYYDVYCFEDNLATFKKNKSKKLNIMGRELAQRLKRELPDIKIIYRGEDETGLLEGEVIDGN